MYLERRVQFVDRNLILSEIVRKAENQFKTKYSFSRHNTEIIMSEDTVMFSSAHFSMETNPGL
jgi:hypothetical protein